jgi:Transglutaminase-like superfamily
MSRLAIGDLAWCDINGTLVFLDIANDRYFSLTEAENNIMRDQFVPSDGTRWHQPCWIPKPLALAPVEMASDAFDSQPFNLARVARAMWVQRRVEQRLAIRGFRAIISHFRDAADTRACTHAMSCDAARKTIAAFEHSRLIRTAADRCLPRSIALAMCLLANGVRSHVVIGVKLGPFAAHCWVQADGEALNESVAEVQRYQPILAI